MATVIPGPRLLAGINLTLGALHFIKPDEFDKVIPDWVPGDKRFWTHASGVVELATGVGLLFRNTRPIAGLASAGLYAIVFPANVEMVRQAEDRRAPGWYRAIMWARLPWQLPLIVGALRAGNLGRH
ncbi:hypothetical protein HJ590_13475 [Naumannella sp. ID2617S]|uniref:DoxX family protein n=1 Tax=Enemella dayhoffiae TaxID=2016507 RepID=A0A255GQ75_9ACTN|nr:hypothetical protein [Enemella dayhoffiae]NNG20558.1 hypothetical protein [Naumannella sp. ID2617S]OYO16533.1 hypothetical protein CGZ93_17355 [Enemella dayhoffiae]